LVRSLAAPNGSQDEAGNFPCLVGELEPLVVACETGVVECGPRELTSCGEVCTLNKLPWSDPRQVVRDGVCLFFENSTVCCFVSAMFVCVVCVLVISAMSALLVGVGVVFC
jgi:hypothetical protein